MKKLKVFEMNDCDWWADYTPEEAKKNYLKHVGYTEAEYNKFGDPIEPRELSNKELRKNKILIDNDYPGKGKISFKIHLKEFTEPGMFASSEY